MKWIKDIINQVAAMKPYKVSGDHETYSQYNEGWQDALGELESRVEEPKISPQKGDWVSLSQKRGWGKEVYEVTAGYGVIRGENLDGSFNVQVENGFLPDIDPGLVNRREPRKGDVVVHWDTGSTGVITQVMEDGQVAVKMSNDGEMVISSRSDFLPTGKSAMLIK